MADSKISALADGGRGLFDDLLVSARGGGNNKHSLADIAGYWTIGHPRRRFSYVQDWAGLPAAVGAVGSFAEIQNVHSGTGAGIGAGTTPAVNRVGIVNQDTGTTTTGRTVSMLHGASLRFGGGLWTFEAAVAIPTLSTGTQRFQYLCGFFDVGTAANQVDGAYFLYDEGGVSTGSAASANWQTVTAANSTRTFTTTGTTVTAAQFYTLRIAVNAAASSVSFFIDGVDTGTAHTTNIPSGAGRELGGGIFLIKSVGTTARQAQCDYFAVEGQFDTPRAA